MTSGTVETRAAPSAARASYVLVLLCLINAFSYLDRNMIGLVLPQMTTELALSDTTTGLVAGLPFALCYALCAIPAAWIADNSHRRNLLAGALTLWSVVTALTGSVQNGWQLAIARFGLGAGESAGHPTISSLVADLFSVESRTAAFAAVSASAYIGPLVGFPLIGWLLEERGWRTAFYAMGAGGLAMAAIFVLTAKEPPRGKPSERAARAKTRGAHFVNGVKRLLSTRSYRFVVLAGGFNAVNQGAHMTWGPTFLSRIHDLGATEIGFYFGTLRGAAGLFGAFTAALVVGSLVKRDVSWQIRAPIFIAAIPFFGDALFLLTRDPSLWQAGLACSALATAISIALSYPLYVNVAAPDLRAQAAAFYFLVASLMGFILGPFIVGSLSDLLTPSLGSEAITWAMLTASAFTLIAALLLWLAKDNWIEDMQQAEAG